MSNKVKVGILGLGRAGFNMHYKEIIAVKDKFEVVAGMDNDPQRRDNFSKNSEAVVYDNIKDFLNDSEIELVSIATRSPLHVQHALQALSAGKAVFLEKPIAMNSAEMRQLVAADKQYPNKLYLRHNRRFELPFEVIKDIIDSGKLGSVYEIKLHRHSFKRRNDWQTIIACGGGQLNNWGPHIIDHALQFLNGEVADVWSDLKRIAAVGDAEDHLKIILKGKDARVVDIEISGGAAIPQSEYIVFGTKGALECTGRNIKLKLIEASEKLPYLKASHGNPPLDGGIADGFNELHRVNWREEQINLPEIPGMGTRKIWNYLYDSLKNRATFPISIKDAVQVVELTERIKNQSNFVRKKAIG